MNTQTNVQNMNMNKDKKLKNMCHKFIWGLAFYEMCSITMLNVHLLLLDDAFVWQSTSSYSRFLSK